MQQAIQKHMEALLAQRNKDQAETQANQEAAEANTAFELEVILPEAPPRQAGMTAPSNRSFLSRH